MLERGKGVECAFLTAIKGGGFLSEKGRYFTSLTILAPTRSRRLDEAEKQHHKD